MFTIESPGRGPERRGQGATRRSRGPRVLWAGLLPLLAGAGLVLFTGTAAAGPGTLRTTDGRNLEGKIAVEPGGFAVTPATGAVEHVELARVKLMQMEKNEPTNEPVAEARFTGPGLLGAYFDEQDLTGKTVYRLDETINFDWGDGSPLPDMPPDQFSIRWTGQLEAPTNGEYTFFLESDDGTRLWLDGELIIDAWRTQPATEEKAKRTLAAGRKYDLKLEYFEETGQASVKLRWQGPGLERSIIGKVFLSTTNQPPLVLDPAAARRLAGLPRQHGVLLRDGSFLAWPVRDMADGTLRFADPHPLTLPLSQVALIHLSDLSPALAGLARDCRPGVLLKTRDFIEGEVKSMTDGNVTVSSVLFGLERVQNPQSIAALIFRRPVPSRCRWEIKLRNQSLLRVDSVQCGKNELAVMEGPLRGVKIPAWELLEFRVATDPPRPAR